MTQLELAESIARKAHDGQFRRDGKTPYVTHPQRVAKRIKGNEAAQVVAWLHDVLEDTEETADSLLSAGISQEAVEAVKLLTKDNSHEYHDYLERIRSNKLAKTVKVNDMLDNLSDTPSNKQIIKYAKGLLILMKD